MNVHGAKYSAPEVRAQLGAEAPAGQGTTRAHGEPCNRGETQPGRMDPRPDGHEIAGSCTKQRDELKQFIRGLDDVAYAGVEIIKEYRLVDEFARNVADMLTYLNDKLMPRKGPRRPIRFNTHNT